MNDKLIQCLGKMTYGIYVLTTSHKEDYNGMIASWASQVSYEPPMIMVAVHPDRYSHKLIEKGGGFALHILAQDQKSYMTRFKGIDPKAKFSNIEWSRGKTGSPILKECLAYMECVVKESLVPGNHTIYIGEIIDSGLVLVEEPLTTLDYEKIYVGKS